MRLLNKHLTGTTSRSRKAAVRDGRVMAILGATVNWVVVKNMQAARFFTSAPLRPASARADACRENPALFGRNTRFLHRRSAAPPL